MKHHEVTILKAGYAVPAGSGQQRADGTISLIKGPKNLIVDTGGPRDRQALLDALARESVRPEDVEFVVCTHGHCDHTGNNNLFPDATFIVSHDVCKGDLYTLHDFAHGEPYKIDDDVEVIATPGHTKQDVSVLVRTARGVVAIVGDLFESEGDLENEDLWRCQSKSPEEQAASRKKILAMAAFIVPGHGEAFRVMR